MRPILLFDATATGHHGEFLENMIYGIPQFFSGDCWLLTHPDLRSRLEAAKVDSGSEIRLNYLVVIRLIHTYYFQIHINMVKQLMFVSHRYVLFVIIH